jgi:hypothetical protein
MQYIELRRMRSSTTVYVPLDLLKNAVLERYYGYDHGEVTRINHRGIVGKERRIEVIETVETVIEKINEAEKQETAKNEK